MLYSTCQETVVHNGPAKGLDGAHQHLAVTLVTKGLCVQFTLQNHFQQMMSGGPLRNL